MTSSHTTLTPHAPQTSLRRFVVLWLPASLIAISILLPILYLVIRAFGGQTPLGELIFRAGTLEILGNSLLLAGTVTLASIVISLPIAWLTVRTDLPGKRLWAIFTALPLVIPSYIGAYLMASALGPKGIVQGWLQPLGVDRLPSIYGFPGAAVILTLLTYPYVLLSLRAALQNMNPALEEASRVLGYSAWQTFWRVTFPQLRPALLSGSLLVVLYALRDFGAVSIMRYNTFTRALYVQYQSLIDRSAAAALALVMMVVTVAILVADSRIRKNHRIYSSGTPNRPPTILKLGKWKLPAILFLSSVLFFALIMPAANLGYWLGRGIQAGEKISNLWPATQNSIIAGLLTAGAALLAALPITILSVRYPGKLTNVLEKITYIGYSLPGVMIALALVFFGANYVPFLYQTLPLLVFAYLVLFLPQAVGTMQTSLVQVHPNLEEAGRSLGKQPIRVFAKITLPMVRPGMGAGVALVFLTTMKELPATLILAPFGFNTLATAVWGAVEEAFFAQAAAPALLLILVSSIPMAFFVIRKRL